MPPAEPEKDALLSRRSYDRDAPVVGDDEPLSDEESIDGRPSGEVAEEDQDVFEDDYEEDSKAQNTRSTGRTGFGRFFRKGDDKAGVDGIPLTEKSSRQSRASKRHRERVKRGERDTELVYDMEEGGQASQSPSRDSSEVDLQRIKLAQAESRNRRRNKFKKLGLHAAIIAFFLLLLFGAYNATKSTREKQKKIELALTLSNGTSLFAPTTILISLDGFRADFLQRGLSPTLSRFIQEGVSPLYMLPSFPSVTFPNHYTMVTGLYPESHGIVGNTFWDPDEQAEFYYTHPQQSLQSKWWGGEPVWLTAEHQGVKTAIHMWPGSEASIGDMSPSHVDKYNGHEALSKKVSRILGLLDLPGPDSPEALAINPRPQLIAAYVPNVDADGHEFGPNSTEIRQTIRNVDDMLAQVFNGLQERNLTDIVNVIVVSDHGMATTSTDRMVQLEDLLDINDVEHIDGWPLYGIRPKDPSKVESMYSQLKEKTKDMPHLHVYLRDKDMPKRYHFSKNPRIAPLWIVPDAGWAIATKDEFDVAKGKAEGVIYHPRGLHGYDHENSLMRAIFVARGPAFPHPAGSRVDSFQNIELYNIICDTLGINPVPNNGTLRLPFKPVGQHSDTNAPKLDTPYDPPTHGIGETSAGSIPDPTSAKSSSSKSASPSAQKSPTTPKKPDTPVDPKEPVAPEQPTPPEEPTKPEAPAPEEPKKGKLHKWWEWISDTFEDAKKKLSNLFGKDKSN